jgi:REP element-mobilizing transposase RayT
MSQYDYKPDYHRNLPHFQPPGATFFVTFRLANSLPLTLLRQLKEEAEEREQQIRLSAAATKQVELLYLEWKRQFGRLDDALDKANNGQSWLSQPKIAAMVAESLHYRDGKVYDLEVFSIMPTHAHVVFTPLAKETGEYHALQTILHSLKRHTARQGNQILGREGQFWHHESYDHVIRNGQERERIVKYVLNNPVKAGLVECWEDWPWNYLNL